MSVFSETYLDTLKASLATATDFQLHNIIRQCAIACAAIRDRISTDGVLELSDLAYLALEARWRCQGHTLPRKHALVRMESLPPRSPSFVIVRGGN